jgi:hypothetical protein
MSKDPRRNEIKGRTLPFAPLEAQHIGLSGRPHKESGSLRRRTETGWPESTVAPELDELDPVAV